MYVWSIIRRKTKRDDPVPSAGFGSLRCLTEYILFSERQYYLVEKALADRALLIKILIKSS